MIKRNEVARQVNTRDEYKSVKAVVRFEDLLASGLIDKTLYLAKLVGLLVGANAAGLPLCTSR